MSFTYPVRLASIEALIATEHGGRRPLVYEEIRLLGLFAQAVLDDVEEAWPVDTSLSRDSFEYEVHGNDTVTRGVGFDVLNDVWYAQYVHYAGTPANPPLWLTLIPEAVQVNAERFMPRIRRQVLLTEQAIRLNTQRGGRGFLDLVSQRLADAFRAA